MSELKKIKGEVQISGEKRCYVKCVIKEPCKECGEVMEHDLEDQYLSYPEKGEECETELWCHKCDKGYPLFIKVGKAILKLEYKF